MCEIDEQMISMRNPIQNIIPVLLTGLMLTSCAQKHPQSYDDCILAYLKPGMDRVAAALISQSCRAKFPENQPDQNKVENSRELTSSELAAITGRASFGYGLFSGEIYNGNPDLTLTQLAITVTMTISGKQVSRIYRTDVSVSPDTASSFSFQIVEGDPGATYSWNITGARGR